MSVTPIGDPELDEMLKRYHGKTTEKEREREPEPKVVPPKPKGLLKKIAPLAVIGGTVAAALFGGKELGKREAQRGSAADPGASGNGPGYRQEVEVPNRMPAGARFGNVHFGADGSVGSVAANQHGVAASEVTPNGARAGAKTGNKAVYTEVGSNGMVVQGKIGARNVKVRVRTSGGAMENN